MKIPVVDFSSFKIGLDDVADEKLNGLSEELKSAFTEVGFVYLKNTGIAQQEVDAVMDISKKFFLLPDEVKSHFSRSGHANYPNHGWVSSGTERLNPRRAGDLKEAFNTTSLHPDVKWPSNEVLPGFREMLESFFLRCKDLSLRVLRVISLSLGLDPEVFLSKHVLVGSKYGKHALIRNKYSKHALIGSEENSSTLRTLYYPPVRAETVKEGQVRCGEHSDYGTITLVFQSAEGGLQVLSRSGDFVSAPSIPDTVLINIADLMQRWTADVFISAWNVVEPDTLRVFKTRHDTLLDTLNSRVLLPPPGSMSTRQSLAFFLQPDDDALITCCDGSDKYPPVKSVDYLLERFEDSYGRK